MADDAEARFLRRLDARATHAGCAHEFTYDWSDGLGSGDSDALVYPLGDRTGRIRNLLDFGRSVRHFVEPIDGFTTKGAGFNARPPARHADARG